MQGGDEEDVGFGCREKEELKRTSKTEIKAKSSKSILSGAYDDEVYSMQNSDKIIGKCFIFNHMTFTYGPEDRPYSELDAIALKSFFGSRGFDVTVYPDKRASQIKTILENETKNKKEYHKEASCFVCCVLTHGEVNHNEEYLCANDTIYPTESLFAPFDGDKCDSLAGKPKIFFIQACRGNDYDPGISIFYNILASDLFPRVWAQPQGNSLQHMRETVQSFKIPVKADFLIAYSTSPKFIAWKRNGKGSWFIQSLCEVLEKRADDSDLLSMLTVVCRKVAYEYESLDTGSTETDNKKQVPSTYSTLTKMVKFPPKKN